MTCEACELAKQSQDSGLYINGCKDCERRHMAGSPELWRHLDTMKRLIGRQARADYLSDVRNVSGDVMADLLKDKYLAWWESNKAK
jgi:hypothetical protein